MNLAKRIEVWPVERLRPYERNARTHSPEQVAKIAASLAEFGFTNPILVDTADGIIAGHGRLMAAKELGLPEVPVIVLDHLSDAQRRAYILADNKLAELAELAELAGWDVELLAGELRDLLDEDASLVAAAGFEEAELSAMLDASGNYIDKKDILDLDAVFDAMLDYFIPTPALSIAMAQGGDFIGGKHGKFEKPKRKAMNSFLCATDRPFQFYGRLNEDLTATAVLAPRGGLFLTIPHVALQQKQTQANPGGLTEMYLDSGTYVKSFYSVMYQPSSVQISILHSKHSRIHHKVHWRYTAPYILSESTRKA